MTCTTIQDRGAFVGHNRIRRAWETLLDLLTVIGVTVGLRRWPDHPPNEDER